MSWIFLFFFCSCSLAAGASCAEMASDGDEGEGGRIVKPQPSIMSRGSRQEVNGKRTALFEERWDQREQLDGHEEESGKVTAGGKSAAGAKSPRSPASWAEKDGGAEGGRRLLVWHLSNWSILTNAIDSTSHCAVNCS